MSLFGILNTDETVVSKEAVPAELISAHCLFEDSMMLSPQKTPVLKSHDGKIKLILDGHIFNTAELQIELENEGVNVEDGSPNSIIVAAIAHWEEMAFGKFVGGFAIAVWFQEKKSILLARDHFGIKSLSYHMQGNTFSFASHCKNLQHLWDNSTPINLPALHHYLSFGHSSASIHLLEGVHTLAPGHFLWLGMEAVNFWPVYFSGDNLSPEKEADIENLLLHSIQQQVSDDKRMGIILNGKSTTAILAALALNVNKNIQLFNFNYTFLDEKSNQQKRQHSQKVANACGVNLKEITVDAEDIINHFQSCCHNMDTAHAAGSYHSLYCGIEKIKDEVDVLLNGNGANIYFAGHPHYRMSQILSSATTHPKFMGSLISLFDEQAKQAKRWFKLKEYQKIIDPYLIFDKADVRRLLLDDYDGQWYTHSISPLIPSDETPLSLKMQWFDLKDHLPGHGNWIINHAATEHGLEARFPFQHPQLVEWVLGLSENDRINGDSTHPLLNKIVSQHVPKEILQLDNINMHFPYGQFMKSGLSALLREQLSEQRMEELGLFNTIKLEHFVKRQLDEDVDQGQRLWSLLSFVTWHSQQ